MKPSSVSVCAISVLSVFVLTNAIRDKEKDIVPESVSGVADQSLTVSEVNVNIQRSNDSTDCDCGKGYKSCWIQEGGQKFCECQDGYAFDARSFVNKCYYCMTYCNANNNSQTCVISSEGVVSCICKVGFKVEQWNYQCEECYCGSHGECSFPYSNHKQCECEKGYSAKNGICTECDCGPNGRCDYLSYSDRKICSCRAGFKEKDGQCYECDCGPASFNCYFDDTGTKQCQCKDKKRFVSNGRCENCDCTLDVECSSENGTKVCLCPAGFEDKMGKCQDINECVSPTACARNAYCINTNGSYYCKCKLGYKTRYGNDPKFDGCEDINECREKIVPCINSHVYCVNTPGSYKCVCDIGYLPSSVYNNPENNSCYSDQHGWKTATAVVGIILLVLIIAVLGFITVRCIDRRRQSART